MNHRTLASFLSLFMSSSTSATRTPPALSLGLYTSLIIILGATSIPSESKATVSTLFFFAPKILFTFANLGVFNLKSQVKIAGRCTSTLYNPKSTSLNTVAFFLSSEKTISELKVAHGIPIIEERIYPVCTKSSSIAYFPNKAKSNL